MKRSEEEFVFTYNIQFFLAVFDMKTVVRRFSFYTRELGLLLILQNITWLAL